MASTDELLHLKCQTAEGATSHFRIKRTTRLRKLIEAYCDAEKTGRGNLRFLFDGEHIGDEQTPAELDMEDGDVIDVLEGQVGGGVAVAPAAAVSEY